MAPNEPARILLALDACSELSSTLAESVVAMAARLDAELEGLFVDDAALLRAAALPFVREVSAAGKERTLTPQELRARSQDVSENLERLLARVAHERKVRWTYRRAEGNPLAAAYAASTQCDLFVPGRSVRQSTPATASKEAFQRVGMIIGNASHTSRALSVVRTLARNGHTREVLLVSEGHRPANVLAALSEAGLRTFVQATPFAETAALFNALGQFEPGLLIAPRALFAPRIPRLGQQPVPLLLLR